MPDHDYEKYVCSLDNVRLSDIDNVGGKNASLGELIGTLTEAGVVVPGGFATTAHAYREFLQTDKLGDRIQKLLASSNPQDVNELAIVGSQIREWIMETPFVPDLLQAIQVSYEALVRDYGE